MHLKRKPVKWWQSQLQYVNSRKCKHQDWLRRNCFHIGNLMLIHSDGSVQERSNSVAYALGLRLCCTNPSIWNLKKRSAYLYSKLISLIEIIFDTQNVLLLSHYSDVIMGSISSQIISLTIVYSSVYSGADQRKHQNSASLPFVRGIHQRPVNFPHEGPVTRKCFHLMTSSWITPDTCLDTFSVWNQKDITIRN